MEVVPGELTSLLEPQRQNHVASLSPNDGNIASPSLKPSANPMPVTRVLPVAFFASLSMAATSATTVYAYAHLLCVDPRSCKDSERNAYAGAVAIATCIASVCGILVMGFLERLVKKSHKWGLLLWLGCRATSVSLLAVGVLLGSITIAISGRLFEGFASDNILHFNLNAIYVQQSDKRRISYYMGVSLGLFMVGMAIGPGLAACFENFTTSFIIALGIFALSIIYVCLFIRSGTLSGLPIIEELPRGTGSEGAKSKTLSRIFKNLISPLRLFWHKPRALFHGLSILLHNTVQGYLFPTIMVFASIQFQFTSVQNGYIVSIAAGTSAIYLFVILIAAPKLLAYVKSKISSLSGNKRKVERERVSISPDAILAIFSLGVELGAVIGLGRISQTWQIYVCVALSAFGLAAPSFIKSHFVAINEDGSQAVAALALMEGIGSLLAPVILGVWQTTYPDGSVFNVAASLLGLALCMFAGGAYIGQKYVGRLSLRHQP